ncbi:unnamed protein product [Meganyctiphanes norvegica]|uniref:C2H2-type domain-containing protein n=1 Tax=Meganyctiphanes norvegica TaxID=48144 RepID=A0AAV2PT33_MEGNR
MDSTVCSDHPSSLQSNQVSSSTQKQINMDVSPTQMLDDQIRADLFELLTSSEYDTVPTGLSLDWGMMDDLGYPVNPNNDPMGNVSVPSWTYNCYQDLSSASTMFNGSSTPKDKDTKDTMWGGGTEKVINSANGERIIITFPSVEPNNNNPPDITGSPPNPPPAMNGNNNLDLFYSIVNEKPNDMLVSQNHRSPASDCVSYASAGSGYSDSGISTSMDDISSPAGANNGDHIDFDRLVDSAVDSFVYSPSGGSIIGSDEGTTAVDINGTRLINNNILQAAVTQSNDVTSILEGALRGTVRRPSTNTQIPQPTNPLMGKNEAKMLTLMSNMKPLPPMSSIFKKEHPNIIESSNHISSSGIYLNSYDYHPVPPDDVNNLDMSFNKLSTTTPEKHHELYDSKNKKRKYTKRSPSDEPNIKARLMHFCPVCQKGFKDKYSVTVHIRTHTGEKPFNCELCGKCFRQKVHLEKHVKVHNAMAAAGKPMNSKR